MHNYDTKYIALRANACNDYDLPGVIYRLVEYQEMYTPPVHVTIHVLNLLQLCFSLTTWLQ